MPLPLIPVLLAAGAAWLLFSEGDKKSPSQPGGSSPAGGAGPDPFPGSNGEGSQTSPEAPGTGGGDQLPSEPDQAPQEPGNLPSEPAHGGAWLEAYGASVYRGQIDQATADFGLPDFLLARVLWQESRFNPDAVHANADGTNDQGIAQVNTATAANPGYGLTPLLDPFNPDLAIPWAGQYLAALYAQLGSWRAALQGYNGGAGNVQAGTVSRAAQNYASSILSDVGIA